MADNLRRIVELDDFQTARPCEPSQAEEIARRYMTLIAADSNKSLHGGSGNVMHMKSVYGDDLALKSLIVKREPGMDDKRFAHEFQYRRRAFDEEYRAHKAVNGLDGFPALYGRGSYDGGPVILMEWVDGFTSIASLELAFGHPCHDGGFPAEAVAALGLAVTKILLEAQAQNPGFAHRDISPKNIMLRTNELPLRDQFSSLRPQACIIDMGSANLVPQHPVGSREAAAITMQESVWRFGTAEYAAPEMVTSDVEGIAALRRSNLVDVYALCCVLYELYSGHTPYEFWRGERIGSLYRVKMDEAPYELKPKRDEDAGFVEAVLSGVHGEQVARASMEDLHDALAEWLSLEDRAVDVSSTHETSAGGELPASERDPQASSSLGNKSPALSLRMKSRGEGGGRASG